MLRKQPEPAGSALLLLERLCRDSRVGVEVWVLRSCVRPYRWASSSRIMHPYMDMRVVPPVET